LPVPSQIALRPLEFTTVLQIIDLRVSDPQSQYVAPNATSIAEGLLNPGAWLRAIYADDMPVGFLMLHDPKIQGAMARSPVRQDSICLTRLMISHELQKRGYAKRALDLACRQARLVGGARMITSFVPGEHGPEHFYSRYGFVRTGSYRANGTEPELILTL
jgi:diamine N-acetyltransferase